MTMYGDYYQQNKLAMVTGYSDNSTNQYPLVHKNEKNIYYQDFQKNIMSKQNISLLYNTLSGIGLQ